MPGRWTLEEIADALAWAGVALLALAAFSPAFSQAVTAWTP